MITVLDRRPYENQLFYDDIHEISEKIFIVDLPLLTPVHNMLIALKTVKVKINGHVRLRASEECELFVLVLQFDMCLYTLCRGVI